jgi:subtilisin family serine protease
VFARHARRQPPQVRALRAAPDGARPPRPRPAGRALVTLVGGAASMAMLVASGAAGSGPWAGLPPRGTATDGGTRLGYRGPGQLGTGELTVLHDDGSVTRLPANSGAAQALSSGARAAAGVRAVGLTRPVTALEPVRAPLSSAAVSTTTTTAATSEAAGRRPASRAKPTTKPSPSTKPGPGAKPVPGAPVGPPAPSAAELAQLYHLRQVGAQRSWTAGRAGTGITVAVLDSGIDRSHPDLTGQIVGQVDCTGPRGCTTKPAATMPYWHGTHVAGVIAAAANGKGVVGVAPRARLLDVRVLDADGRGDTAMVTAGVEWAIRHGAKILNLSIGSPGDDPALHAAIRHATARGLLVVTAAGNDFDPCDRSGAPSYPAAYPETFSVAAATADGGHAWFSSVSGYVDIAAPGISVVSDSPGNQVSHADGTSVAAPQVSGAAADVWSGHPTWTAARVRAELERTAIDLGVTGRDDVFGAGLVQAAPSSPATVPTAAQPEIAMAVAPRTQYGRPVTVRVRVTAPGGIPACGATVTLQVREVSSRSTVAGVWRPVARVSAGDDGTAVARVTLTRKTVLRALVSGPHWLPPGTGAEAEFNPAPVLRLVARRVGGSVVLTVRAAPAAPLPLTLQRLDPVRRIWVDVVRTCTDLRGTARVRLPAGRLRTRLRVVSAASPDWPAAASQALTARITAAVKVTDS